MFVISTVFIREIFLCSGEYFEHPEKDELWRDGSTYMHCGILAGKDMLPYLVDQRQTW